MVFLLAAHFDPHSVRCRRFCDGARRHEITSQRPGPNRLPQLSFHGWVQLALATRSGVARKSEAKHTRLTCR